jgi:rRNA-processing protein FCF1
MEKLQALISDANVLIDILKADEEVLKLAAEVYDIYLPYVVLQEVEQLDEDKAVRIGLKLYEEGTDLIAFAIKNEGKLSMEDIVCFEIAKANGFTCLTNDSNLRARCEAEGVAWMRGFRLLLKLVEAGKITKTRAKETGKKIKETNKFIKQDIFKEFVIELERF